MAMVLYNWTQSTFSPLWLVKLHPICSWITLQKIHWRSSGYKLLPECWVAWAWVFLCDDTSTNSINWTLSLLSFSLPLPLSFSMTLILSFFFTSGPPWPVSQVYSMSRSLEMTSYIWFIINLCSYLHSSHRWLEQQRIFFSKESTRV